MLALVATLMPLVWDDVLAIGRAGLILTLVVLFAVEYRAIDKDRADSLKAQANQQCARDAAQAECTFCQGT